MPSSSNKLELASVPSTVDKEIAKRELDQQTEKTKAIVKSVLEKLEQMDSDVYCLFITT
jgi:hypothetical protein